MTSSCSSLHPPELREGQNWGADCEATRLSPSNALSKEWHSRLVPKMVWLATLGAEAKTTKWYATVLDDFFTLASMPV